MVTCIGTPNTGDDLAAARRRHTTRKHTYVAIGIESCPRNGWMVTGRNATAVGLRPMQTANLYTITELFNIATIWKTGLTCFPWLTSWTLSSINMLKHVQCVSDLFNFAGLCHISYVSDNVYFSRMSKHWTLLKNAFLFGILISGGATMNGRFLWIVYSSLFFLYALLYIFFGIFQSVLFCEHWYYSRLPHTCIVALALARPITPLFIYIWL